MTTPEDSEAYYIRNVSDPNNFKDCSEIFERTDVGQLRPNPVPRGERAVNR